MMGRTIRSISFDAKKDAREAKKNKFKASDNAEREFYRALKKVAKHAGHIVETHSNGAHLVNADKMMKDLTAYAELLTPWARRQAEKLLEQVNRSNKRAYRNQSQAMSVLLKTQVAESDVGMVAMSLLNEQVDLIKSIPLEAGLRAQKIAADNYLNGMRAVPDPSVVEELVNEMGMTTEVAINRAKLIARTGTARANSAFVEARALAVGVKGYIWRTTMDGAERKSHAKMNGKFVEYSKPPTLIDGTTGHAGTFPNCRCYQDPVLPEL